MSRRHATLKMLRVLASRRFRWFPRDSSKCAFFVAFMDFRAADAGVFRHGLVAAKRKSRRSAAFRHRGMRGFADDFRRAFAARLRCFASRAKRALCKKHKAAANSPRCCAKKPRNCAKIKRTKPQTIRKTYVQRAPSRFRRASTRNFIYFMENPPQLYSQTVIASDEDGMRAALSQSARGRGFTSPRPSVGCVLVRDGKIIGAGHTQPGDGNPHAEVMALRDAAARRREYSRRNGLRYLEPCSHFRTTPPCSLALIDAGIARAVCGVRDPNPAVDGRGLYATSRSRNRSCRRFYARRMRSRAGRFSFSHRGENPMVTLKSALSLDGKIAMQNGESQWISGEESRRRAHVLRHENDAVLVGIETVLADDPQLSVRLPGKWKQPQRIVLDSRGRIPLDARVLAGDENGAPRVIIATTEAMPQRKTRRIGKTRRASTRVRRKRRARRFVEFVSDALRTGNLQRSH